MNLTHTVQSIAHDAASAASDLSSQAAELGSKAAEKGADAASSVADAATNLAHAIARKVPGVKPKRKPWRLFVVIALAIGGVAAALKGRRKSGSSESAHAFSPSASTASAGSPTAGKAASSNGDASGNGKVPNSTKDAPPTVPAARTAEPASEKKS